MSHQDPATPPPFTVVITSCDRFDLLRPTLHSLLRHIDGPLEKILIVEDSGKDEIRDVVSGLDERIQVLVNQPQMGQMKAIDRAYGEVKTDYVFHCEDDWEFSRGGFIAQSWSILQAYPEVSMVGLRARDQLNPLIRDMPVEHIGETAFFQYDPTLHPEYFSYSFNPGLRRMCDYQRFAPLHKLGMEHDVSYHFKKAGFRMANLEVPAVRHIGDERHVNDPNRPPRAKNPLSKLQRSLGKRVKRIRRKLLNE